MNLIGDEKSPSPGLAELRFQIFDLAVLVRCTDAGVANRLAELLEPFAATGVSVPPDQTFSLAGRRDEEFCVLRRNGDDLATADDWAHLISVLVAELNTSAVAGMRCFAAHSGAVADSDGVIAFPSDSGGGKSTIAAACLLTGFDYVSDEALCLDYADGKVLPYPKPIALDSWSINLLDLPATPETDEERLLTPRELGAVAVGGRLWLRDVVLMERGGGEPELRELPRSEAVTSLLRTSFNHYKRPDESFRLLSDIAPSCRVWSLQLGDPLQAARMLRERLSALP